MTNCFRAIVMLAMLFCSWSVQACIWDYDTLSDEQRGLPTVSAILAGRWEKHSDFYYEHRVRSMRTLLATNPNDLPAIDNLAAALEKLGDIDQAIDLMKKKLLLTDSSAFPHYTTHANLGTFYLHRYLKSQDRADIESGIAEIKQAIAINADAHFGREKYQLMAAEFILQVKDDPTCLDDGSFALAIIYPSQPGTQSSTHPSEESRRSRPEIAFRTGHGPSTIPVEKAIEGISGMIRFGTGTSPHLYYALGDLLSFRGDKHLASWAYLRAIEFGHPRPDQVKEALKSTISTIEEYDGEDGVALVTTEFEKEKSDAAAWVTQYRQYEDDLIRAGKDVSDEALFEPLFARIGKVDRVPPPGIPGSVRRWVWAGGALVCGLVLVYLVRRFRRKPKPLHIL